MQRPPAAAPGTTAATVAARVGKEKKTAASRSIKLQTVAATGAVRATGRHN